MTTKVAVIRPGNIGTDLMVIVDIALELAVR